MKLMPNVLEKIEGMKGKGARLMTISAVDERNVVYHFMLKGKVRNVAMSSKDGKFKSIVDVFPNAEMYERECMEMFGIKFVGHPHPRKLFLSEKFKGHPFLKKS